MDNILPANLFSKKELMLHIAKRFRRLRLDHYQWSRAVLADKSGVADSTIKRFENTGQITLENLIALAMAMNAQQVMLELFPMPQVLSIAELEKRNQDQRHRGRRSK
jgi:transcriptional regulator with XRE-family HTH domain